MAYNEIRINDIDAISFLEGHQIVLYVGPKLTRFQRWRLRGGNMPSTLLYLPEFYQKITPEMLSYNYPGVNFEDYSIESINALTDPLSNSVSEKCAAIKKAFLLQINDSIAKNYYVTGLQGGKKGISLDRSLVQWECKL